MGALERARGLDSKRRRSVRTPILRAYQIPESRHRDAIGKTLREIGFKRAFVMHGLDDESGKGMDELSTLGTTYIAELKEDRSIETGEVEFVAAVGDGPTGLRQNQRLTTRILLAEFSDVMMVQRGQFLDSGGGRMAYVINDDRVAQRRQIQTCEYSLCAVEILTGLQPGETIVISNPDPFRGADTVLLTD